MAHGAAAAPLDLAPAGTVRLSGTTLAPRWRGRLHLGAFIAAAPAAIALFVARADLPLPSTPLVWLPFSPSAPRTICGRRRPVAAASSAAPDHAMIYVFTAACCTPYCVYLVPGALGRMVLILVWFAAVVGVLIKVRTALPAGTGAAAPSTSCKGGCWRPHFPRSWPASRPESFALILLAGLLYTAGAVVLFGRRPDPRPHVFGYHEVWHAMVVLASACYFAVLWRLPAAPH